MRKKYPKFTLAKYLDDHYTVVETGNPEEVHIDCPFCGDDTKAHLYINTGKHLFHCFRGDHKINIPKLVALTEKISYAEALKRVSEDESEQLIDYQDLRTFLNETFYSDKPEEQVDELPEIKPPSFYFDLTTQRSVLTEDYEAYLASRNVGPDLIAKYRIGCCVEGLYRKRVVFPIHVDGRLVGYQARDITGKAEPKVLNSPAFPRSKCLFNYEEALNYDEVVVVEGIFGAIHVGNRAVASFGKQISPAQRDLLEEFDRIVLLLDSDALVDAIYQAKQFCNPETYVAVLPYGQPDHFSKDELKHIISNAVLAHSPVADSLWLKVKMGATKELTAR